MEINNGKTFNMDDKWGKNALFVKCFTIWLLFYYSIYYLLLTLGAVCTILLSWVNHVCDWMCLWVFSYLMSPPTCPSILFPSCCFFCGVSKPIPISSLLAVNNILSSHTCMEATTVDIRLGVTCIHWYFWCLLGSEHTPPQPLLHTKWTPSPHSNPRQTTIPQPQYCLISLHIIPPSIYSYRPTLFYGK